MRNETRRLKAQCATARRERLIWMLSFTLHGVVLIVLFLTTPLRHIADPIIDNVRPLFVAFLPPDPPPPSPLMKPPDEVEDHQRFTEELNKAAEPEPDPEPKEPEAKLEESDPPPPAFVVVLKPEPRKDEAESHIVLDWRKIPLPPSRDVAEASAGGHAGGSGAAPIGPGGLRGGNGTTGTGIGSGNNVGSGRGYGSGTGTGTGSGSGTRRRSSSPPRPERMERGEYPDDARRRGYEGTVLLALEIREDGSVGNVETARSSGFPALDAAAGETARHWRFTPATEDGRAISSNITISYIFRLTDAR